MIEAGNIFYQEKYYYYKMSILDTFRAVRYVQFKGEYKLGNLMKKHIFYTKYVDLTLSKDELKSTFSKTVRQKINKAGRESVTFNIYKLDTQEKIGFYINYYNEFAKSKKLHFNISKRNIMPFLDNSLVTYSEYNGVILSMHRYILDNESKIACFVESSSHFRLIDKDDTVNRNFIGIANIFLMYQDMLYLKEKGFTSYDLGGYGVNTDDPAILAINYFKDGFKGTLVQENHFESYPFLLLKFFHKLIK